MIFRHSPEQPNDGWFWRHEIELPEGPKRSPEESSLDNAWRQLVLIHTSFRATAQGEYGSIVRGLREIERLFLDLPELEDYYTECHRPPGEMTVVVGTPHDVEPYRQQTWPYRYRHVAAMQARLMEDVYFVLQLARFANALDNRGWMNLFRSWGQSGRFNSVWNSLRPTFTDEFTDFYLLYIRYYPGPIERYPVPHPWDDRSARQDPRILPADKYADVLPGVFLDSGIREAGVAADVRGAPLPSPGTESRGVTDEETKAVTQERHGDRSDMGDNMGSSSEGQGGPNK
ncbi:MAG: hypothetical protein ACM31F_05460 [Gemmatimonas sp.]